MIRRCREVGLLEPEFAVSDGFLVTLRRPTSQVTGQVTGQVGFVPLSEPESCPMKDALAIQNMHNLHVSMSDEWPDVPLSGECFDDRIVFWR